MIEINLIENPPRSLARPVAAAVAVAAIAAFVYIKTGETPAPSPETETRSAARPSAKQPPVRESGRGKKGIRVTGFVRYAARSSPCWFRGANHFGLKKGGRRSGGRFPRSGRTGLLSHGARGRSFSRLENEARGFNFAAVALAAAFQPSRSGGDTGGPWAFDFRVASLGADGVNYRGEKGTFIYRGVDVREVLFHMAKIGGFSIIMSDDVSGAVDMELTGVPWDHALAVVLEQGSLGAFVDAGSSKFRPLRR